MNLIKLFSFTTAAIILVSAALHHSSIQANWLFDHWAFLVVSICAAMIASVVASKAGFSLRLNDFKGRMSSLILFTWLMIALDLVLVLDGIAHENRAGSIIVLVMLSPILVFFYKKLKVSSSDKLD